MGLLSAVYKLLAIYGLPLAIDQTYTVCIYKNNNVLMAHVNLVHFFATKSV